MLHIQCVKNMYLSMVQWQSEWGSGAGLTWASCWLVSWDLMTKSVTKSCSTNCRLSDAGVFFTCKEPPSVYVHRPWTTATITGHFSVPTVHRLHARCGLQGKPACEDHLAIALKEVGLHMAHGFLVAESRQSTAGVSPEPSACHLLCQPF